jgi:glycosyltransferase involved in cell wall biosynthesis
VYNLGDYLYYHQAIYEVALRRPGVVVLHDLVMRDFFFGYCLLHRRDPNLLVRHLAYSHGAEGERQARDLVAGRTAEALDDPLRLEYPLAQSALHRGLGVVVHSDYTRRRLAAVVPVPVAKLEFPLFGLAERLKDRPPGRRRAGGTVRLLTFGMINPNKAVHATLAAIGQSELLRRTVTFTVLGACAPEYKEQLGALVQRHALGEVVRFTGRASDAELLRALEEADVVVNLRNPHFGESSASLQNSLFAGVPTVVWDHGSYAEFPDDVVCKVSSESELQAALGRLAADPGLRRSLGEAGRAHARGRFRTDAYCDGFRDFAERACRGQPALQLADHVSHRLLELGVCGPDALAERLAAEVARFLPGGRPGDTRGPVGRAA